MNSPCDAYDTRCTDNVLYAAWFTITSTWHAMQSLVHTYNISIQPMPPSPPPMCRTISTGSRMSLVFCFFFLSFFSRLFIPSIFPSTCERVIWKSSVSFYKKNNIYILNIPTKLPFNCCSLPSCISYFFFSTDNNLSVDDNRMEFSSETWKNNFVRAFLYCNHDVCVCMPSSKCVQSIQRIHLLMWMKRWVMSICLCISVDSIERRIHRFR